jgi:serine/threonine protein phosphatase PrpC
MSIHIYYHIFITVRDHTASDEEEVKRVTLLGAKIIWGHDEDDETDLFPKSTSRTSTSSTSRTSSRGLPRVNGEVAVTRSLGDASLKRYLISEPHITILDLLAMPEDEEEEGGEGRNDVDETWFESGETSVKKNNNKATSSSASSYDFLVVATDGLWDVMTSQEVVDYVKARRRGRGMMEKGGWRRHDNRHGTKLNNNDATTSSSEKLHGGELMTWQQVATALTHEALLRGSSDNVGVCIIDIKNRIPWFSQHM